MNAFKNALTVDVEEWFHICGVPDLLPRDRWDDLESRVEADVARLLGLLDRCDAKATFFVLGWVAERHPDMIRRIAAAGHEIASHGMAHVRLFEESPGEFREEVARSVRILGDIVGERPVGFRAAEWSLRKETVWALDVVADLGFEYDSSMTPVKVVGDPAIPTDLHLVATRGGLLPEMPPLTQRYLRYLNHAVPLGCGWGLRFIRNAKIRRTILRRNARGIPACLVLHPWELDPDPPQVALPFWHRFVHYARLGRLRRKLPQLLSSLSWAPVRDVVRERRAAGYFESCHRQEWPAPAPEAEVSLGPPERVGV